MKFDINDNESFFNSKYEYIVYGLLGLILFALITAGVYYGVNIRRDMNNREPLSDNNQYIVIYSDHIHNAALSMIDVGDDGSHIFRECNRTVDEDGNITLELKFINKKDVKLDITKEEVTE